jgi:hypothetical protein
MSRRRRGAAASLAAAACCVLMGMLLPAGANPVRRGPVEVALPGRPFTSAPDGPLLDVDRLVPGASTSAVIGIRNGFGAAAATQLRLVDVHDDDNGCPPPEAAVDRSCGVGGGEIADALVFRVAVATTRTGAYTGTWRGSARQLRRGIAAGLTVPSGGERWLRLTAMLDPDAGNEIQSDTLGFRLRLVLATSLGTAGVSAGPGGVGGAGGLAYTGGSVALLLVGGVLVLLAGTLVVLEARRRP